MGVGDLIAAAGGTDRRLGGVGLGGLSGGWLSPSEAERAVWSRAGLAAYQLTPGPGTVHVLGDDECLLRHVSAVLDHAAGESAGQCGPCMFGVPAVAEDFGLLAARRLDQVGWQRLRERLGLLPGRGACRFPDGVAGYARIGLRAFVNEAEAHRSGGCSVTSASGRAHAVAV